MAADDKGSAPGRRPPPGKTRFQKGQSGNRAGRPKGAVSTKKLTAKFALRKLKISAHGRSEFKSRLEIAVLKLIALAADGKAAAVAEMQRLKLKVASPERVGGGLLVVPEPVSLEEFIARAEEANRNAVAPNASLDLDMEDLVRPPERDATILDRARQAHRRKYGR